ncbi:MAG: ATP-binding protein [Cyanobacteriota bacterium]
MDTTSSHVGNVRDLFCLKECKILGKQKCIKIQNNFYCVCKTSDTIVKNHCIRLKTSFSFLKNTINSVIDDLVSIHGFPEEKAVDTFIILSELLVNAIEHGNKNVFNKSIMLTYSVFNSVAYISVEDEGKGFDYSNIINNKNTHGLILVSTLVDGICWNDNGNKVYVCIQI